MRLSLVEAIFMRNLTKSRKKRVIVFGIFDGIHDGHRSFFAQAKKYGNEIVVIVGRNSSSVRLKKKKPKYSEEERLKFALQEQDVDLTVLGDEKQSSYDVLEDLNPNAICLGYDQKNLAEDLKIWMQKMGKKIPMYCLNAYHSGTYHNSVL